MKYIIASHVYLIHTGLKMYNNCMIYEVNIYFGTKILVLNDILENKSYEQELTEDLILIIHYFTMKN